MNGEIAAKIIDDIVASLRTKPNQFQLDVKVNISESPATADGGGIVAERVPPFERCSVYSSATINIQIAQKNAEVAFSQEMTALQKTLTELAEEIRSKSPNEAKVRRIHNSMNGTWVPGVITSVVGDVISLVVYENPISTDG
ncbi:MAG TPA: hypothetical protein VLS90_15915 [Thermodesulfobacteriota bacterium]|nr:hypothetical protein [Thermodesulfobacteriota bacterium]